MTQGKTNAMRILDAKGITYTIHTYDSKDGKIDGVSVAQKINREAREVYKTLVAQGTSKQLFVFIIPVEEELDLKKAAKEAKEKKVDMIPVRDIQKLTGYMRGGCSPIGMKKLYKTFIHEDASQLQTILVSGGKIGLQMELSPNDLQKATEAEFVNLVK